MSTPSVIDRSKIVFSGWFEKVGGNVHSWKKRFFVIYENALFYYKEKDMKEQLGTIPLIDINITFEPPNDGPGYYFMLKLPISSGASRSEYLFRTQTEEERIQWQDSLFRSSLITVFGKPLMNALKVNPASIGQYLPIPYFFPKAIQYLETYAMDIEGIYRLNGSSVQIENLVNKINNNQPVEFTDAHATTGLIKLYMRDLPDPLLLKNNFSFLKSIGSLPEQKQPEALAQILRSLPISNYALVYFLFAHLRKLLTHGEKTLMNERALAVCIGPSLIRADDDSTNGAYGESSVQQTICCLLFQHFDTLFSDNPLMFYGSNGNSQVYRLKISQDPSFPFVLHAEAGSVIQAVAEDKDGWLICVYNSNWGIVHKNNVVAVTNPSEVLGGLAHQKDKWVVSSGIIAKMSEKCPDSVRLYELLSSKLKEIRKRAAQYA